MRNHFARRWMRWLLPDAALCAAVLTIIYALAFYGAPRKFFSDANTGFHIRAGQTILETHVLPRTDPYSFSQPAQPWFDWDWGADCLTAAAFHAAGPGAVTWLFLLVIAGTAWVWFRFSRVVSGNILFSCLFFLLLLPVTSGGWLALPHLVSWVLAMIALYFFETAPDLSSGVFRRRHALYLLLGTALWSGLARGSILVPALAALYSVSHTLRMHLWRVDPLVENRRVQWFMRAGLYSAAGLFLTPYGVALPLHALQFPMVSPSSGPGAFSFTALLVLGLAAFGAVLALSQKKLAHFLLSACVLAGALRSPPLLPLVPLFALPLANGAFADGLRKARDLKPALRRLINRFLRFSDGVNVFDARLAGRIFLPFIPVLTLVWLALPFVAENTGFSYEQAPVFLSSELKLLPADSRVFAPMQYGSYLIFRQGPDRKVFIDARGDFYGQELLSRYQRLMELRPGWEDELEAWHFDFALLPRSAPLAEALNGLGWRIVIRDEFSVLLRRGEGSAGP